MTEMAEWRAKGKIVRVICKEAESGMPATNEQEQL